MCPRRPRIHLVVAVTNKTRPTTGAPGLLPRSTRILPIFFGVDSWQTSTRCFITPSSASAVRRRKKNYANQSVAGRKKNSSRLTPTSDQPDAGLWVALLERLDAAQPARPPLLTSMAQTELPGDDEIDLRS